MISGRTLLDQYLVEVLALERAQALLRALLHPACALPQAVQDELAAVVYQLTMIRRALIRGDDTRAGVMISGSTRISPHGE